MGISLRGRERKAAVWADSCFEQGLRPFIQFSGRAQLSLPFSRKCHTAKGLVGVGKWVEGTRVQGTNFFFAEKKESKMRPPSPPWLHASVLSLQSPLSVSPGKRDLSRALRNSIRARLLFLALGYARKNSLEDRGSHLDSILRKESDSAARALGERSLSPFL